jgi:hypothetical protein
MLLKITASLIRLHAGKAFNRAKDKAIAIMGTAAQQV